MGYTSWILPLYSSNPFSFGWRLSCNQCCLNRLSVLKLSWTLFRQSILCLQISSVLLGVVFVSISFGHFYLFGNYSCPLHHNCTFFTLPLRLPMSTGLSLVLTWFHCTSGCCWILCTLFATNCLWYPPSLIQCKVTLLSNQQTISPTGNPSNAKC